MIQGALFFEEQADGTLQTSYSVNNETLELELRYTPLHTKTVDVPAKTVAAIDATRLPQLSSGVQAYIEDVTKHNELLLIRNGEQRPQRQAYRDAIQESDMQTAQDIISERINNYDITNMKE
jgi:hypothetical protein